MKNAALLAELSLIHENAIQHTSQSRQEVQRVSTIIELLQPEVEMIRWWYLQSGQV